MLGDICIAGINKEYIWKRPIIQPNFNVGTKYIFNEGQLVLNNCNIVKFNQLITSYSGKPISFTPKSPHSEDFLMDFDKPPIYLSTIQNSQRIQLFKKIDESTNANKDVESYLINNHRSLILIKPDSIESCLWKPSTMNEKSRIAFFLNKRFYELSCTDIKWRALRHDRDRDLKGLHLLSNREVYFVIGLSRLYKPEKIGIEKNWPMIVGVHTIPDYKVDIQYDNL